MIPSGLSQMIFERFADVPLTRHPSWRHCPPPRVGKIEGMETEPRTELPAFLAPLFWDVDLIGLDAEIHRDFVIGRILSAGTLESIRWGRSRYGDDALREWIVRHEGRQLSGPQLRFWETVIGLPHESVNAWLTTVERRIWQGRAAS